MPSPGSSGLAGDVTHRLRHAAKAGGILLGVIAGIDLEFVFDDRLSLHSLGAAQFWLMPAFGIRRIIVSHVLHGDGRVQHGGSGMASALQSSALALVGLVSVGGMRMRS